MNLPFNKIAPSKIWALFSLCFVVALCSCSRGYDLDFQLSESELAGTWCVEEAPPQIIFPTNSSAKLELNADKTANLSFLPLAQLNSINQTPSWYFSTGKGTWNLEDDGNNGRHVWHIRLQEEKQGVQLTVGKRSGKVILVYRPNVDIEEQIVFAKIIDGEKK
jgi:hypothetical protein